MLFNFSDLGTCFVFPYVFFKDFADTLGSNHLPPDHPAPDTKISMVF